MCKWITTVRYYSVFLINHAAHTLSNGTITQTVYKRVSHRIVQSYNPHIEIFTMDALRHILLRTSFFIWYCLLLGQITISWQISTTISQTQNVTVLYLLRHRSIHFHNCNCQMYSTPVSFVFITNYICDYISKIMSLLWNIFKTHKLFVSS